jgi:hypothetical protein
LAKSSWQDAKEQYGSHKIRIIAESFRDLKVYKKAFVLAMKIFEITKKFPKQKIRLKLLTALYQLPT